MKQSLSGNRPFARYSIVGWYCVAAITWGGLIASLPGYYIWFLRRPLDMQFTGLQLALTIASGFASLACALISGILATILFVRKPNDPVALFVSFFLLVYGFINSGPLEMIEYQVFRQTGVLTTHLQLILLTVPTIILMLIFPNGVLIPRKFRWIIPCSIPIALILGLLPAQEINSITTLRSKLLYVALGVLFLLSLGAQVYRYLWKSTQIERQQTKMVVYGLSVTFVFMAISAAVYFPIPDRLKGNLAPGLYPLSMIWWISLSILPISFTLAVIRSHLWDIDIIIRRTLVYGFLTAILLLVYFSSVILAQSIIRLISGQRSPIAILISTIVIYVLFNPLRSRIQSLIDRRFFRSKYNAEQTLIRFQQELSGQVHLDQVENGLIDIVKTVIQPKSIALWIREPTHKE